MTDNELKEIEARARVYITEGWGADWIARTAVPALVARVRELEAERAAWGHEALRAGPSTDDAQRAGPPMVDGVAYVPASQLEAAQARIDEALADLDVERKSVLALRRQRDMAQRERDVVAGQRDLARAEVRSLAEYGTSMGRTVCRMIDERERARAARGGR